MFDQCNVTYLLALNGRWVHGVGGFVLKFASELDLAHFYAVLHGTRILVFPDDEVATVLGRFVQVPYGAIGVVLARKKRVESIESNQSNQSFPGCLWCQMVSGQSSRSWR